MNTKKKVITSFTVGNYDDANLYLISQSALAGLTANATTFPAIPSLPPLTQPPAPAPPTRNLTDASADFFAKLVAAMPGGTDRTADKDASRVTLVAVLGLWANYVNLIGDGVTTTLRLSGFDLNKDRSKVGVIPKPTTPTVTSPGANQLMATVPDMNGVYSWLWQYGPVAGGVFTGTPIQVPTSKGKLFVASKSLLPSSTVIGAQVMGIGADGSAVNWSDIAAVTIQS